MKKIRFEDMLPEELSHMMKKGLPLYLPVSPIEWHGPHMGMGVDAIHARWAAEELAKRTGGAVFPTLYMGTDTYRDRESLNRLGLDETELVMGMDFPQNTMKSAYWNRELFREILTEQVRLLEEMGFDRIVILNGHGAKAQKEIICDLCEKENQRGKECMAFTLLFPEAGVGLGHAGLYETALMMTIRPEMVDLEKLPPKPKLLRYKDYAIADSPQNPDGCFVIYDPRDADEQTGKKIAELELETCEQQIRERYGL